ncbi:hypothetical protein EGR_11156 [Echinococcus granulosus]|uniref:Uncharacterized protein n=1 Tax=Echinococcus granulosus TaxID=6210 RepID=W6U6P1_ECHGR|nr:hypothetical protein EGR_11156 [Echinococcus granulosus]EUB53987.1 hypothetical protein EGR_11156 [Echinococcus granulosus]
MLTRLDSWIICSVARVTVDVKRYSAWAEYLLLRCNEGWGYWLDGSPGHPVKEQWEGAKGGCSVLLASSIQAHTIASLQARLWLKVRSHIRRANDPTLCCSLLVSFAGGHD